MVALDWQVIAEIATTVSTIAFAASAIVVVVQLRQAARERYFAVTAHLFEIWQSPVSARSAVLTSQASKPFLGRLLRAGQR
jgi:hypothetical protein